MQTIRRQKRAGRRAALLLLVWATGCAVALGARRSTTPQVSLTSLLHELTDRRAMAEFPEPAYRAAQMSSYDRRTVAPDQPGWFANEDGYGYVRTEEHDGRMEKVLFDEEGPGAVTRFWMTTPDKRGTLRFYFDGAAEPQVVVEAYDMSRFPLDAGAALVHRHTHYKEELARTGGTTSFLPLPYARHLKITLEEPATTRRLARYYQVGFRTYPEGTTVRTFTLDEMRACAPLLKEANEALLNPVRPPYNRRATFEAVDSITHRIRARRSAISELRIRLLDVVEEDVAAQLAATRMQVAFDGTLCVDAPLAQLFGGGFGAQEVHSWYFDHDGHGQLLCRWVMPFRRTAELRFLTADGAPPFRAEVEVCTQPYTWTSRTLYFHAAYRVGKNLPVTNDYNSMDVSEWNLATLSGRGVYVGDVLSVDNHLPKWFGEGDEKIFVDDDRFPSFMGTGLEDYYNCSWAPVISFLTPFGGVPRSDEPSSHGWTTWLRTRNLDAIPFTRCLRFDFELEGWTKGAVDYYATSFWYGE